MRGNCVNSRFSVRRRNNSLYKKGQRAAAVEPPPSENVTFLPCRPGKGAIFVCRFHFLEPKSTQGVFWLLRCWNLQLTLGRVPRGNHAVPLARSENQRRHLTRFWISRKGVLELRLENHDAWVKWPQKYVPLKAGENWSLRSCF